MNLIRYYNQNRKKIWGILIIIASAFLVLQFVNYIYKTKDEKRTATENNIQVRNQNNIAQLTTNQSVITGENVDKKQLESATATIDQFISYCNNHELEKAYDLLTDECKTQIYNTLEIFEQAYYNDVFNGEKKTCTIENWVGNTYKVRIIGDLLSTGKKDENAKQDYITIKEVNGEEKLNINRYIGQKEMSETTEENDIKMEVLRKNTYMDYEEYTIAVTNQTESTMILDSGTEIKTLYLQDKKGVKYSSYSHELTEPMLTVNSGQTKEVTIKFYSSYVSTKEIESIVFSDIILYQGQGSEKVEFRAKI